jgi:hypothetical protein
VSKHITWFIFGIIFKDFVKLVSKFGEPLSKEDSIKIAIFGLGRESSSNTLIIPNIVKIAYKPFEVPLPYKYPSTILGASGWHRVHPVPKGILSM